MPVEAKIRISDEGVSSLVDDFQKLEKVLKDMKNSGVDFGKKVNPQMATTAKKMTETAAAVNKVDASLKNAEKSAQRFGKGAQASSDKLKTLLGRTGGAGIGAQMGGLYWAAGGIGAAAATKRVLDFKEGLGRLQAESRMSTNEMRKIEEQILRVTNGGGIMADQLTSALLVFQNYGGSIRFGTEMLQETLDIHKATGAEMAQIATISSALHKTYGMNKEEVMASWSAMKSMAIAGTLDLGQVAPDLPQLLGLGKGFGFKGIRGVQQMGAAQQVIGELLPNSAEARTALQGVFRNLINPRGQKQLQKMKIDVFNKDGTIKDIDEVMLKILRATGGIIQGPKGLSSIFNDEGFKAALAFASSYDKTTGEWIKGSNAQTIFGAGKSANADDITRDARLYTQGIAAESEKVKQALSSLEAKLMRYGGSLITWAANNTSTAAILLGGGVVAAKFTGKILEATGIMARIGPQLNAVLGSFALAYSVGTLIDEFTDASGKLADFVFSLTNADERLRRLAGQVDGIVEGEKRSQREANQRLIESGKEESVQKLTTKAKSYVAMGAGRKTARGKRIREIAEGELRKEVEGNRYFSKEEKERIIPQLIAAASGANVQVVIKPAAGIDKLDATVSRGPRQ